MANNNVFLVLVLVSSGICFVSTVSAFPQSINDAHQAEFVNADEIEDMDKIFETYERQYLTNDPWSTDQLLVQSTSELLDRHIITSRASKHETFEGSGEDQPSIRSFETEQALNESVATVQSIIDEITTERESRQATMDVEPEPEKRTIVVVVTTNVFTDGEKKPVDKNKEQHDQLSFGLPSLLCSSTPNPKLDMHNKATSDFFNAEIPKERPELEEGTFELLTEIPTVSTDKLSEITIQSEIADDIDPIIVLPAPTEPNQDSNQSDTLIMLTNTETINKNDHIPDAIESIPHADVREKFIADIPNEPNLQSSIKTSVPAYNGYEDINGYVVEEVGNPHKAGEADAILIDVNNVVPEKCKTVINDVVYIVKDCENKTLNPSRSSRQLEDLSDDELTLDERTVLEPARRLYDFDRFRESIPRYNRSMANNSAYEDMRFMNFLHSYLLQFTGRNYIESEELEAVAEQLLARKHILETVTVSVLRDMSEYIEKTTYFNFPNHTALLPGYVLTGDRNKDQQRLDRLVYNRRFAAQLWSRGKQSAGDNAKNSEDKLELSVVSISEGFNPTGEEVSATLGNSHKLLTMYRQKIGTYKKNDNVFLEDGEKMTEVGNDESWRFKSEFVPWYHMTPEERRDVEFAAYLHALIDTSEGILPRIAYYIYPQEKYDEVQRNRDSRSLVSPDESKDKSTVEEIVAYGFLGAILKSENVGHKGIVRQEIHINISDSTPKITETEHPEPSLPPVTSPIENLSPIEVISTSNAETDTNTELSDEFLPINSSQSRGMHIKEQELNSTEEISSPLLIDVSVASLPEPASKSDLLAQDSLLLLPINTHPEAHLKTIESVHSAPVEEIEGSGGDSINIIQQGTIESSSQVIETSRPLDVNSLSDPIAKKLGVPAPTDVADTSSSEESHEIDRRETQKALNEEISDEQDSFSPGSELIRSVVEAVELSNDVSRAIETFRDDSTESAVVRQTRSEDPSVGISDALFAELNPKTVLNGEPEVKQVGNSTFHQSEKYAQDQKLIHNAEESQFQQEIEVPIAKDLISDAEDKSHSEKNTEISSTTYGAALGAATCLTVSVFIVVLLLQYRKMRRVQRQFIMAV